MTILVDAVLPVFAIIATGFFCRKRQLLGDGSSEALNRFVYWVALPALLFKAMATVELDLLLNWPYIYAFSLSCLMIWLLVAGLARWFGKTSAVAALAGLNGSYANTGYMGIPLTLAVFGDDAILPAIVATIITVLLISLAVIPIQLEQKRVTKVGEIVKEALIALFKNPLFISPVVGLLWAWLELPLPVAIKSFTEILGAAAGPCALFSIGVFLVGKPISKGMRYVGLVGAAKLLLHPLITGLLMFYVFPTDDAWAKVGIMLAALPVGAGTFVLAQEKQVSVEETSATILVTTILSLLTISVLFVLFPN